MGFGPLVWWFPRRSVTRAAGCWARSRLSRPAIALYIKRYGVDPSEAEKPVAEYQSLAEFFGRRLKVGSRPIDHTEGGIVSPCDALLSAQGVIDGNTCMLVKGVSYSVPMLLAANASIATPFHGGWFMTLYLSPRDYHRVHVPMAGEIVGWTHVPGTLYPVNTWGVKAIPTVFMRNERVITYIRTDAGTYAVVMVGAFVVGGISLAHIPQLISNRRPIRMWSQKLNPPISVSPGDELGQFNFGSTVILLFPPQVIQDHRPLATGSILKMGQLLARQKGDPHGNPVAF